MTDAVVERIAGLAEQHGFTVAAAESLTSGQVAARIGAGPSASEWFQGAVVAYDESVKFEVLGVEPGPVVTEACARQMAAGAARLLGADAVVATTGVGGPDPEEGQPAGTVVVAVHVRGRAVCRDHRFDGDPPQVLAQSVDAALDLLVDTMAEEAGDSG